MPVSYVSVDAPDIVVRRTCCANSASILARIKRRLTSFAAPDRIIDALVPESITHR
jgi:hypothetical protein